MLGGLGWGKYLVLVPPVNLHIPIARIHIQDTLLVMDAQESPRVLSERRCDLIRGVLVIAVSGDSPGTAKVPVELYRRPVIRRVDGADQVGGGSPEGGVASADRLATPDTRVGLEGERNVRPVVFCRPRFCGQPEFEGVVGHLSPGMGEDRVEICDGRGMRAMGRGVRG